MPKYPQPGLLSPDFGDKRPKTPPKVQLYYRKYGGKDFNGNRERLYFFGGKGSSKTRCPCSGKENRLAFACFDAASAVEMRFLTFRRNDDGVDEWRIRKLLRGYRRLDNGMFYPDRVEVDVSAREGDPEKHIVVAIRDLKINPELSDGDFTVAFPPGTTVADQIKNQVYKVMPDGSLAFVDALTRPGADQDIAIPEPPAAPGTSGTPSDSEF